MPIHDHFKGEISQTRSWISFHYLWAGLIAGELNRVLPEGFIAESTLYTGAIEVDVRVDGWSNQAAKSVTVIYQIPVPSTVIHTANFEVSEVQIFDLNHARKTVGVIEIVSPANKDRAQHQEAFLAKCYSFIAYGVSTVIVDIVTTRSFNFHEALMQKFQADDEPTRKRNEKQLYCSAYRYRADVDTASSGSAGASPSQSRDKVQPVIEVWHYPLQVGDVLPDLPLFISPEVAVPVKLEDAYLRTCRELKIG